VSVVGLDACKRGWVAIVLRGDAPAEALLLATVGQLAGAVPDATTIGIDIPIGMVAEGHRPADLAARAAIGPRRHSLFLTPVRAAVEATDHATASAINVARAGAGISRQAYGLRAKILEVDRWRSAGAAPCHVVEVHPELSFTTMIGHPPTATKRSWHGLIERRAALDAHGIDLSAVDPSVGAAVGIDDLLDAAAVAWSASRVADGTAQPYPDPPTVADDGGALAIWS
jgi:predicted RNase H-like nuclease